MDLDTVRAHRFAPIWHEYTERDAILYALGVGYGSDPCDPAELAFVYEDGLKTVPSICNVLAHPGFWAKDPRFGIKWMKILHGEQDYEIHAPIPAAGKVRGEYEIEAVEDRGDKGARLHQLKRLFAEDGTPLATVRSVIVMRGDGGHGGFGAPPEAPGALPDAPPDETVELATLPQQALIYRLSGDLNPIHADPKAAKGGGFAAPILHGLCTLGLATRALLQSCAPGRPEALTSMFVRFSSPVFPGETLVVEIFRGAGDEVRFRCRVKERDVVVLDRGRARIAAA